LRISDFKNEVEKKIRLACFCGDFKNEGKIKKDK